MTSLDDLGPDFAAVLARVRAAVEERLASLWADRLASLRRHGAEVTAMVDAARDLTLRGGKRYRAALLAAAYAGVAGTQGGAAPIPGVATIGSVGAKPLPEMEPALAGGVALELLQTYLLIQDDWMDRDDTRRGGPSVHAALAARLGGEHLGAASALLASDLAWNLAFEVLASIDLPAPRVVAVIRLFTRIHEDVIVGQQIDLMGRAEDVEAMHALKTGSYTVRGPLLLGAALAGAPAATLDALERYAAPIGVAFQLRDDLLGAFGLPEETGKPVGNDLRAGKRTAVLAEAEGRLSDAQRAALGRAFRRADATHDDVAAATAALEACGARAAVTDRLARLCREAESLAAGLPVTPAARVWLAGAAAALAPKPS